MCKLLVPRGIPLGIALSQHRIGGLCMTQMYEHEERYLAQYFGQNSTWSRFSRSRINGTWMVRTGDEELVVRFYPPYFKEKLAAEIGVLSMLAGCEPPNGGEPWNEFEEGQWYHPAWVTPDRVEYVSRVANELIGHRLVRKMRKDGNAS